MTIISSDSDSLSHSRHAIQEISLGEVDEFELLIEEEMNEDEMFLIDNQSVLEGWQKCLSLNFHWFISTLVLVFLVGNEEGVYGILTKIKDLRYILNQWNALVPEIQLDFQHILRPTVFQTQVTVFPAKPTSPTREFSTKSNSMLETRLHSSRICIWDMRDTSLVKVLRIRRSVTILLSLWKAAKMALIAMKGL